MNEFEIERHADPALSDPVLIEGLPGVGHVGKLAADHLLDEFESEPVATVYSEHFPPQVTVDGGVSGLVLGLGGRRGFEAACLMGETSGYLVDPKSARAILDVLCARLDFEVDYASLDERADEMEEVMEKMQEMQQQGAQTPDDDLRYIG